MNRIHGDPRHRVRRFQTKRSRQRELQIGSRQIEKVPIHGVWRGPLLVLIPRMRFRASSDSPYVFSPTARRCWRWGSVYFSSPRSRW